MKYFDRILQSLEPSSRMTNDVSTAPSFESSESVFGEQPVLPSTASQTTELDHQTQEASPQGTVPLQSSVANERAVPPQEVVASSAEFASSKIEPGDDEAHVSGGRVRQTAGAPHAEPPDEPIPPRTFPTHSLVPLDAPDVSRDIPKPKEEGRSVKREPHAHRRSPTERAGHHGERVTAILTNVRDWLTSPPNNESGSGPPHGASSSDRQKPYESNQEIPTLHRLAEGAPPPGTAQPEARSVAAASAPESVDVSIGTIHVTVENPPAPPPPPMPSASPFSRRRTTSSSQSRLRRHYVRRW